MTDLSTNYLGLHLDNPLVPSASPLSAKLDNLRRMEDAGAAAVVLPSLFEEQINHETRELDFFLTHGTYSYAEALTYFSEPQSFHVTPDAYLEHVHRAKDALTIPVIGSLNGVSSGGWVSFARDIEAAGADALELNLYFVPTDPYMEGCTIEQECVDLLSDVLNELSIPVAVKLSPYFTNVAAMVRRLDEAGAAGLVLFNRFFQPDIDLDMLDVVSEPTLSHPADSQTLRLPLCWIGILYGRVRASLAASSGIHTAPDVVKLLMVGADVTMMASALLRSGIDHLAVVKRDLRVWLEEHEYESLRQLRGSMSQRAVAFPSAFERAHYIRAVTTTSAGVAHRA
jgi:dihydroorotate dehydrogenase (fumarate)